MINSTQSPHGSLIKPLLPLKGSRLNVVGARTSRQVWVLYYKGVAPQLYVMGRPGAGRTKAHSIRVTTYVAWYWPYASEQLPLYLK